MTTPPGGLASLCGPAAARQMSGGMGSSQEGCATKRLHLSEPNKGGVDLRTTSPARHGWTGGPRYDSPGVGCSSDLRMQSWACLISRPVHQTDGWGLSHRKQEGVEKRDGINGRKGRGVGSSVERSGACRRQQAAGAAVRPGPCRTQSRGARMHGQMLPTCCSPRASWGKVWCRCAAERQDKALFTGDADFAFPATITQA